ncbi:MAG: phosphatase PAP2 family protein [Xanthomonadales bacterium]|nr:phosphatase PAP2 family protein [Xanthomonadales bacterium]
MKASRLVVAACLCGLSVLHAAHAGGPLGIDHTVAYDDSGIWNRNVQKGVAAGVALTTVGGALFVDGDTRLGRTFDQSFDAMVLTAGATTAMKLAFSRKRPSQTNDPNDFFQGGGAQSFPSGEVAEMASVVTPFILEYRHDHPAVYALALLPAYDAVARVKTHGHWQSDVLAGAAVGVALGVYAHHRATPIFLGLTPDGGGPMIGYARAF